MVDMIIYKNEKNECVGFVSSNHAGYAEEGQDIVCAATSMLVINTINALESFTDVDFTVDVDDQGPSIDFRLTGSATKESTLLLETMILGLQSLVDNEQYENYIDLTFEEV